MSDSRAAARLRLAFELHATGVRMMKQRLRRQYPSASAEDLQAHLRDWLHERPGARYGDAEGQLGAWPREA